MANDVNKLNIYHEIFSCERVYHAEKAWEDLKAHDYIEISYE